MKTTVRFEIFPWNDNFSTGIPSVDEQHTRLVSLINTLATHLSQNDTSDLLNEILDELAAYAVYHFKSEEEIWAPVFKNDPLLAQHKRSHDAFLPGILDIKTATHQLSHAKALEEVLKFLVNWLLQHILDSDRRMAKVVLATQAGVPLEAAKQQAAQDMSGLMQTYVDTVLEMYATLTSRSLELISEKNERIRVQEALLAKEERIQSIDALLQSMEKTVQVLAAMIEIRSPYTAGHQRRVAQLVSDIAQEMGLSEFEIHGMYLAATIHDVGDIQIPAEILVKPAKLTSHELKMVQQHPKVGYQLLKDINFPWPIAQIICQHHERLDGSGYPNGLKEPEIILGARVLAVADVLEAMSSHRPYRPSLGVAAALEEIEQHRGILYDATVVDACLRLFREKSYTIPQDIQTHRGIEPPAPSQEANVASRDRSADDGESCS